VNHRLVRGLDYYTRTVFEVQPREEGGQNTLGGGGRYDDLIEELGGKPTPAIGFAVGIERIILNLKKAGVSVPAPPAPRVFIACLGEAARDEGLRLAARLREAGVSAVAATGHKSLKAQLRQANSLGTPFAVIIGEDEVKAGTAVLRDIAPLREVIVIIAPLSGIFFVYRTLYYSGNLDARGCFFTKIHKIIQILCYYVKQHV
jgi:histidyl-tRNA synthetase